ncbi:MAG: Rha family transcriptional regulator [Aeromonas sp.]
MLAGSKKSSTPAAATAEAENAQSKTRIKDMNYNNSLLVPDHLISINGDKLVTTSLKIAEVFGKRHDDVLKKISNLECSDHFRLRNFAETVYYRKNPSSGEDIATKMWNITKDGFVFIAMGFTGKKAAQFKEFYINAFNAMAEQLTKSQPAKKPRKSKALQLHSPLVDLLI